MDDEGAASPPASHAGTPRASGGPVAAAPVARGAGRLDEGIGDGAEGTGIARGGSCRRPASARDGRAVRGCMRTRRGQRRATACRPPAAGTRLRPDRGAPASRRGRRRNRAEFSTWPLLTKAVRGAAARVNRRCGCRVRNRRRSSAFAPPPAVAAPAGRPYTLGYPPRLTTS